MKKYLVCLLCSLIPVFSIPAFAQLEVPPEIQWQTLHTPHFQVIFNAKQQELGQFYAEKLEKAYHQLSLYFQSLPETTVVVINDKTDVTNGYATRIPYPHIMIYPVLPGPEESLADTGDWIFELLAHEYTHILNFEPANGVMKPLRSIFGSIIAPNLLLPTWWKEGLAVEMETRLGNHGRLRSFYQDATLRAMVEDGTLASHDIAKANEFIPSWPEGMRPYLFGSLMWSQMMAEKGPSIASTLNERQGGRVPYFIEAPAHEHLGKNYSTEYERMIQDVTLRAQEQLKILREATISQVITPKNSFSSISAPAISPDGKHLAVVTEDDANSRAVKLINRETPEQSFLDAKEADTVEKFNQTFEPTTPHDGPPSGSIQRISWFPDSLKIIYDKIDYTNRIERYSDLYTYDLTTKKTASLTKGLRAREPSVSPQGDLITFVKLEGGKTHLGLLRLSSPQQEEILFSPDIQQRISYPSFWDQDTILFSLRKADGSEYLHKFSLSTKKWELLFSNHPNVRFAKKTSEGLLFTSSRNGVLNLYLTNNELQKPRPVSHALTAFFTGDLDPLKKEIYGTHMTSQGLRVVALTPEVWQNTPKELPIIKPMMADRYPADTSKYVEADIAAKAALKQSNLEDYSPYGYLWPQYWMPFIAGSTSETGTVITAQTSGFDPLKKHSYTLLGSWDTGIQQGSIEGSYLNQVTSLPIAFLGFKRTSYLGTVTNKINDYGAALAVLPDMFWFSRYASLQLGWQYIERSTDTMETKRTGPFAMLNYTNYSKSGAQISPESGFGAYLGAYNYIQTDGYLSHSQLMAGGEIYLSSFLPKHHAIMLKANGVYTPEKIPSIYGVSTESLVLIPDSPLPQYILRGYPRGQLFGRNLASVNAEYRLPLHDVYSGSGTDPIFLRRFSGALVVDGAAADGLFVNNKEMVYEVVNMKRSFWSAGLELKLETTIGYLLPLNLVFGYYNAFNTPTGNEGVFGTTLQISGF